MSRQWGRRGVEVQVWAFLFDKRTVLRDIIGFSTRAFCAIEVFGREVEGTDHGG
jgi:hypothetical protein